jgi:hypothetical protein
MRDYKSPGGRTIAPDGPPTRQKEGRVVLVPGLKVTGLLSLYWPIEDIFDVLVPFVQVPSDIGTSKTFPIEEPDPIGDSL